MKITTDTATSLGDKLAGLELSDEEGVLLTAMLSSDNESSDNEVEGFAKPKGLDNTTQGYTEVEWIYRAQILGPLPKGWRVGERAGYTEIEWT